VLERPSPHPGRTGHLCLVLRRAAGVPVDGTHWTEFGHLLYVGVSPSEPPRNGKAPSQQNLRKRIRYHFRGNAAGSTLRLTLGSLLAAELGIELRRVGSGNRFTFSDGGPAEGSLAERQ
jgi:hypothetical protein